MTFSLIFNEITRFDNIYLNSKKVGILDYETNSFLLVIQYDDTQTPTPIYEKRRIFMSNPQQNVRVAVIQAASVIMDREASAEKAISLTLEAGEKGANIVVFPEAFIPA